MKPHKSILDPTFVYVPSHLTDVAETFRRVIAEGRQVPKQPEPSAANLWAQRAMQNGHSSAGGASLEAISSNIFTAAAKWVQP